MDVEPLAREPNVREVRRLTNILSHPSTCYLRGTVPGVLGTPLCATGQAVLQVPLVRKNNALAKCSCSHAMGDTVTRHPTTETSRTAIIAEALTLLPSKAAQSKRYAPSKACQTIDMESEP